MPDAARLNLAVSVTAPSVTEALAGTASAVAAVVEVATRVVDRDKVASRGFWVHPDHTPQGRRAGFAAGHRLVLDCPSLDAAARPVEVLRATPASATAFEPGSEEITATVTVTWSLV